MASPEKKRETTTLPKPKGPLRSLINVAFAVLVALAVRAYVAEPFRIPTGSMEPTLLGAEGWGDRIFAGKFSYSTVGGVQTGRPDRWDVVVFYRRPDDAFGRPGGKVRYIKRLIGLPGERIEICDGNIYASGRLQRKPPGVQQVLWHALYEPDFSSEIERRHWSDCWSAEAGGDGRWEFDGNALAARVKTHSTIRFRRPLTNLYVRPVYRPFICHGCRRKFYARVDTAHTWAHCPHCDSDLDVLQPGILSGGNRERYPAGVSDEIPVNDLRLDARFIPERNAAVTLTIISRRRELALRYSANTERLTLSIPQKEPKPLGTVSPSPTGRVYLSLRFYDERIEVLSNDVPVCDPIEVTPLRLPRRIVEKITRTDEPESELAPRVKVRVAFGEVRFNSLAVYRDIYYTLNGDASYVHENEFGLWTRTGENQYWVMGDNSPSSSDSRYWGPVNRGDFIGRAWFVFWPLHRIKWIR